MGVKQITIFLENKPGRLRNALHILEQNEVNIRALSLADTANYGVLRLIVNNPEKAVAALKAAELTVSETEVLAVSVADQPGGLVAILDILAKYDINIEYTYAFVEKCRNNAVVVLRVEKGKIDAATAALRANGIELLPAADVYAI